MTLRPLRHVHVFARVVGEAFPQSRRRSPTDGIAAIPSGSADLSDNSHRPPAKQAAIVTPSGHLAPAHLPQMVWLLPQICFYGSEEDGDRHLRDLGTQVTRRGIQIDGLRRSLSFSEAVDNRAGVGWILLGSGQPAAARYPSTAAAGTTRRLLRSCSHCHATSARTSTC